MTRTRGGHVLATVLFTDIVDSSGLAKDLGDRRWRVLLDRHHSIVRRVIKRYHGREIDNAGDGFFASFGDQVDAIRCACQISDDVAGLGIEIRAGCHVGQAEVVGRKLGGVTVHAGARVMSEAGPSEVLVSSMIKDLVPASGFTFADRGLHQLKGIEGEWHLFAVTGIDGERLPGRPEPEEMARRREQIKPLPIAERPSGRIGIVALGIMLVVGAVVYVQNRPHPIQIQPNSLLQIDPSSNAIVADVPVAEPDAAQIAFVSPTHEIWVLSQQDQVISVVNASSRQAEEPVPLFAGHAEPAANGYGIAYAFGGVWVTGGANELEEFNPRTKTVGPHTTIPGAPALLSEDSGLLWVTMTARDRVFGINPQSLERVRESDPEAAGIAIASGEGSVWTGNPVTSGVSRVNLATGKVKRKLVSFPVTINGESLDAHAKPSAITVALGSVWVSDNVNGVVYKIDPITLKVVATIVIGGFSPALHSGIAELDGSIWVASPGTKTIVRIDPGTNTVTDRIPVPYPPNGLVTGDGSVWVTVNPNPR